MISKFNIENILLEYPKTKNLFVKKAIAGNQEFLKRKANMIKKMPSAPLYGLTRSATKVFEDMEEVQKDLNKMSKDIKYLEI